MSPSQNGATGCLALGSLPEPPREAQPPGEVKRYAPACGEAVGHPGRREAKAPKLPQEFGLLDYRRPYLGTRPLLFHEGQGQGIDQGGGESHYRSRLAST